MSNALDDLIAKVEAGEAKPGDFLSIFGGVEGSNAYDGSLDAAKVLHEAVLPGYGWHIREDKDDCYASCLYPNYNRVSPGSGVDKDPARAWLIAILRAMREDSHV